MSRRSYSYPPTADFTIVRVVNDVVFIVDNDRGPTVTNTAAGVVTRLLENYPAHRIVYRDTGGRWDELRHDGRTFTGFAPLSNDDRLRFAAVVG